MRVYIIITLCFYLLAGIFFSILGVKGIYNETPNAYIQLFFGALAIFMSYFKLTQLKKIKK